MDFRSMAVRVASMNIEARKKAKKKPANGKILNILKAITSLFLLKENTAICFPERR